MVVMSCWREVQYVRIPVRGVYVRTVHFRWSLAILYEKNREEANKQQQQQQTNTLAIAQQCRVWRPITIYGKHSIDHRRIREMDRVSEQRWGEMGPKDIRILMNQNDPSFHMFSPRCILVAFTPSRARVCVNAQFKNHSHLHNALAMCASNIFGEARHLNFSVAPLPGWILLVLCVR